MEAKKDDWEESTQAHVKKKKTPSGKVKIQKLHCHDLLPLSCGKLHASAEIP